jgi:hypothetical protein
MKYAFIAIAFLSASAFARDVYVAPHVTKNGTYVEGHHRTAPDSSRVNNYSTQGNVNPYTGQTGTVNPYSQPRSYQPYQGYQPSQGYQPYQGYGSR